MPWVDPPAGDPPNEREQWEWIVDRLREHEAMIVEQDNALAEADLGSS